MQAATQRNAIRVNEDTRILCGTLTNPAHDRTRWAQHLLAQTPACVPCPSFEDPAREAEILAPMPGAREYEAKRRTLKAPKDAPAELAAMYEVPLLSREQEQHLFRKMNFLKYKAAKLIEDLRQEGESGTSATGAAKLTRERIQKLTHLEQLLSQANETKELLIHANMRLVVNMARRKVGQVENFFDLLSDGNLSLLRAVEKFDYRLGFKFSTYASRAILMNFARSIPEEHQHRSQFQTGQEEVFQLVADQRIEEHEVLASQERATHSVNWLLEFLEPREREIIRMRAGLDNQARAMTLEEIGQRFGITKERARQLNARAMKKLRDLAEQHVLDLT